jgi:hypothetical protein
LQAKRFRAAPLDAAASGTPDARIATSNRELLASKADSRGQVIRQRLSLLWAASISRFQPHFEKYCDEKKEDLAALAISWEVFTTPNYLENRKERRECYQNTFCGAKVRPGFQAVSK